MLFKKSFDMDVNEYKIRLHPRAKIFLFEHFATLRKLFSSVLGQQETDYFAIALINKSGVMFFLSSKPSIEQNLIEKGLWQYDGSYQPEFIYQHEAKLWSEFSNSEYSVSLRKHKQQEPNLVEGISIPMEYEMYRAVLSFGFKRINPNIQNKAPILCTRLLAMSKYCLREIRNVIRFPDEKKYVATKPKLELIINNQVNHEHTTG